MKHLTRLRACYPQRVNDEDHWQAMCAMYFEKLGGVSDGTLVAALDGAWARYPSFFPSVGELREYAVEVAKRNRDLVKQLAEPRGEGPSGPQWEEVKAKLGIGEKMPAERWDDDDLPEEVGNAAEFE